jgi:hypothetical protein
LIRIKSRRLADRPLPLCAGGIDLFRGAGFRFEQSLEQLFHTR